MWYQEVEGDIIDVVKTNPFNLTEFIVAHGVNCKNAMFSGIAKQIKENFPIVDELDRELSIKSPYRLGTISHIDLPNIKPHKVTMCNLYTQFEGGANFNIVAFANSLSIMKLVFEQGKTLIVPKIGCGIGGGNWNEVRDVLLNKLYGYFKIIVIDYKPKE